ncbi:MAG: DUF6484 domain-containing protein, partial [Byssovorax sp.]
MSHEREPSAAADAGEIDEPAEGSETLLELVLAEHLARAQASAPARIDGVLVGRLAAIGQGGEPRVDFAGAPPDGVAARSMVAVGAAQIDHEVALLFEGGDPKKPMIMGLMHRFDAAPSAEEAPSTSLGDAPATPAQPTIENDGERLVFEADKEIVLRCGKSSITLTRAGKILIRGAYV